MRALPRRNALVTSSFTGWSNYMMDFGKLLQDQAAMKQFGNTVVIWNEVIVYYNSGGYAAPNLHPLIKPLGLSTMEQNDLVVFLESLTGDNVREIAADGLAAPIGDPKGSARVP